LSLVYPIARGASPILVAALSAVVAGERIEGFQAAGVFLIAASIASLAVAGGGKQLSSKAVLFSLGTSVMIAGYTVTDGSGARVSGSVISYVACLFVMNAFPLLVVLSILRPREGLRGLRRQWKTGTLGGFLSVGAYGLVIWAMTEGPMALVSALRETSVVLAAVIGATFLQEPFGRARVLASVGVAAGVFVLRLAS
jgi:drug/metabolite transporter (DMT)-like permease